MVERESNLGKWNRLYALLGNGASPQPYGDTRTYEVGAAFLRDCTLIEDWGCGMGWMRTLVREPQRYRGIDGSKSPFVDVVADLATYRSNDADGIFIRHVIEHERSYEAVLRNAFASTRRKLFLAVFTPIGPTTRVIHETSDYLDVPDISFEVSDITKCFGDAWVRFETYETRTQYGGEAVFAVDKQEEPLELSAYRR